MAMNPLLQLITCGQSYWLDNLTRDMLTNGELHQRVTEQGLRGITSNPATFHKAIVGSREYDTQIRRLVDEGNEVTEIYEQLVVTDVKNACDILRPVYDDSASSGTHWQHGALRYSVPCGPAPAPKTPCIMIHAMWSR
jgi:hypothetical protein